MWCLKILKNSNQYKIPLISTSVQRTIIQTQICAVMLVTKINTGDALSHTVIVRKWSNWNPKIPALASCATATGNRTAVVHNDISKISSRAYLPIMPMISCCQPWTFTNETHQKQNMHIYTTTLCLWTTLQPATTKMALGACFAEVLLGIMLNFWFLCSGLVFLNI